MALTPSPARRESTSRELALSTAPESDVDAQGAFWGPESGNQAIYGPPRAFRGISLLGSAPSGKRGASIVSWPRQMIGRRARAESLEIRERSLESVSIEVDGESVGKRLDRYLADELAVSRGRVRHLLEVGRIALAGRTLALSDKSHSTGLGEVFNVEGSVFAEDERPIPQPDLELDIVSEGMEWVVVNKPAGCGVHPLRPDQQDTVLNAVCARYTEILGVGEGGLRSGVVHRLDVDTTGALIFATTERTWNRLRGAFSEHRVDKRYLALVAGRIDSPLRVDVQLEVKRHSPAHVEVVESGGHSCRQWVTPKRVFANATLVEIDLETGFLHQIRATLAHLGHPVMGDAEYAEGGPDSSLGVPSFLDPSVAPSRPLLHSSRLAVDEIVVTVDLPADFEAVLEALEEEERSGPSDDTESMGEY